MPDLLKRLLRRRRSRALPAASPQAPLTGDPRALKVGDVVNHDGSDFIVEGTLRFVENGFRWDEHVLVDGPRRIWLSVEDDEGELEVCQWERHKGLGLEPGPARLEYDGVTYELDERGTADYTSEGATGAPGGGRVEYVDYASGDRRLGFERFTQSGDWEVSIGQRISQHVLDIYPSGGGT